MSDCRSGTAPAILVVEDDHSLREALCDTLALSGYDVTPAGDAQGALRALEQQPFALVISDVRMDAMDGHTLLKEIRKRLPNQPVVLMTAYGTIQKAVEAMRDGAADYLVKPFEAEVLLHTVQRYLGQPASETGEFIAQDRRSRDLLELAARVAESDATVMITGESGSGKEVLARFIHAHSARAGQSFVAINCAAIPDNMLEATLFGYEKGAYTGAYRSSPGKFEQAQRGTLLLDEISEMELGLQAKLLRVLQEREVEPLGGSKMIPLDVRVLATSNRSMQQQVKEGRFREDLFYRLNVFPLCLPPLRERAEDVLPLAERFIERTALAGGRAIPRLSGPAEEKLMSHAWPGNVRELDNVVQRALILNRGRVIEARDVQFEPASAAQSAQFEPSAAPDAREGLETDLKQHEQHRILEVLQACMGNRTDAATRLGISQRTLRYKLARMREAGVTIPASDNRQRAS